MPILGPYVEQRGGSLSSVGWVMGCYGAAQLLFRIPLGLVSDWVGRRKPFLWFGFMASALSAGLFLTAQDPWLLAVARFLSGLAACAWVAFTVLFASYFPVTETMRSMGRISLSNSLAIMTSTLLGGALAKSFGPTAPFAFGGLVAIVGLALLPRVEEQQRPQTEGVDRRNLLRQVLAHRHLRVASTVAALGQCTLFATTFGFFPLWAVELGADGFDLGLLVMSGSLAYAVGNAACGRWAASRGGSVTRHSNVGAYGLIAIALLAVPWVRNLGFLFVVAGWTSLLRGASFPLLMGSSIAPLPSSIRATAMGFFQASYAVGMFVGPVMSGLLGDLWGFHGVFLSAAAVAVVTAAVAAYLPATADHDEPPRILNLSTQRESLKLSTMTGNPRISP